MIPVFDGEDFDYDSSGALREDTFDNYLNNFESGPTNNSKEKIDIDILPNEKMDNIQSDLENNNQISPNSLIENKYGPNITQIVTLNKSNTNKNSKRKIHLLSNKTKRFGEKINDNKKQKCGRKTRKNDKVHDKFKADNIIRKIKVHILQDKIIKLINDYLKTKNIERKLFKLLAKEIECLKKDKNLILMNSTLKDIYRNYPIGEKYNSNKSKNNVILIDSIYTRNDLNELQILLNLTFWEFYEIYTNKLKGKDLNEDLHNKIKDMELFNETFFIGIEKFIGKLTDKEKNKGISEDNVNRYINEVKKFIREYKEFFEKKIGRRAKK